MSKSKFTIHQEGHCDRCHTKLKLIGQYGIICPKCGPGADPPKHPPTETQIARPGVPCKFCGRNDVSTCRSTINRKDASGREKEYIVWDARRCPMVKVRKGSKDTVGGSGDTTWYVIPPPHERYEKTGRVLPEKEAKKAKEDNNLTLEGLS